MARMGNYYFVIDIKTDKKWKGKTAASKLHACMQKKISELHAVS
jgi:hypothetical protein